MTTQTLLPKTNSGTELAPQTAAALADFGRALPQHLEEVRIVGKWLWLEFLDGKPGASTRTSLKEMGWHWNQNRMCWQNSCGFRSRFNRYGDPRETYGEEKAGEVLRNYGGK